MNKGKLILAVIINILLFNWGATQITFNKRIVVDSLPNVIASIFPTDSCYYGIGLIADSTNLFSFGNIFYKFDLEGNLLFEKRITSPLKTFESWRQLRVNNIGEFYTIGYTKDTSIVNWRSWFVKYDVNGDTLVTKEHYSPSITVNGNAIMYPLDILQTPDSGYIFIANTATPIEDIAVFKLDKNGNQEWVYSYGNMYDNVCSKIIPNGDDYIICGSSNINGLGLTSAINRAYFFSIDSSGNELWSHTSSIEDQVWTASDIVAISDGGYVITSALKTGVINNQNYFIGSTARLNEGFEIQWHNPIYHQPASAINFLADIVETEIDTEFTVWGVQYAFEEDTWGLQPWLAKVSVDGDSLWSRSYTFLGLSPYLQHQFRDVRR